MTSKTWVGFCAAAAAIYNPAFDDNRCDHLHNLKKLIAIESEQQRQHERQLSFLMDYLGLSREDLENKCRELDTPLPVLYDKILAGWYIVDDKLNEPINNGVAFFGLTID